MDSVGHYEESPVIGKDKTVYVSKLNMTLQVETSPWNAENYRQLGQEQENPFADSVIRWKEITDENGKKKKVSNSRIVKWSDGSMQLMIGNKSIYKIQPQEEKGFPYVYSKINPHASIGCQARVKQKLDFIPDSEYTKFQQEFVIQNVEQDEQHKVTLIAKLPKPERPKKNIRRPIERERYSHARPMTSSYLDEDEDDFGDDYGTGESYEKQYYDEYDSPDDRIERIQRPRSPQRKYPPTTDISSDSDEMNPSSRVLMSSSEEDE